jgi:hypothetical protein
VCPELFETEGAARQWFKRNPEERARLVALFDEFGTNLLEVSKEKCTKLPGDFARHRYRRAGERQSSEVLISSRAVAERLLGALDIFEPFVTPVTAEVKTSNYLLNATAEPSVTAEPIVTPIAAPGLRTPVPESNVFTPDHPDQLELAPVIESRRPAGPQPAMLPRPVRIAAPAPVQLKLFALPPTPVRQSEPQPTPAVAVPSVIAKLQAATHAMREISATFKQRLAAAAVAAATVSRQPPPAAVVTPLRRRMPSHHCPVTPDLFGLAAQQAA